MCARAAQQVIRLSLITAIINGRRAIDNEIQNCAEEIWRYCEESAHHIWGEKVDSYAETILCSLRNSQGQGISRHVIGEIFPWRERGRVDAALNWLSQNGLAYKQTWKTAGRPAEIWFATL